MKTEIEIITPDDWHCHLRDNEYLATTVPNTAKYFKRAVVMPNLTPPILNVTDAKNYLARIQKHSSSFKPLLTLYLTDKTDPASIIEAKQSGFVIGCKLYPQGATTNSEKGVTSLEKIYPVLEAMSACDLPLLIHGEVTDNEIDVFDREAVFIERHLKNLVKQFPKLRMVLEHITTSQAVEFVQATPQVAATITPHHLLFNRNDMLVGGIKPHHYCLPILKRNTHQSALIQAAISGNPKFFIGTDSAPHAITKKENACGCAGIYHTEPLSIYAYVFEQANALDKLEGFTSKFGADFYQLPYNQTTCRLMKEPCTIPDKIEFGQSAVVPFLAGETLTWQCLS